MLMGPHPSHPIFDYVQSKVLAGPTCANFVNGVRDGTRGGVDGGVTWVLHVRVVLAHRASAGHGENAADAKSEKMFFEVFNLNSFESQRQCKQILFKGQWCGAVGLAVTSDTRVPRFESSHWQILFTTNCIEKTKINKKEAGKGPKVKKILFGLHRVDTKIFPLIN